MGTGEAIVKDLLSRDTDAAILVRIQPDPRFQVVPYARHRIVAVVGEGHPWRSRGSVAMRDFHRVPMVVRDSRYSLTSQVFEEALRERRIVPEATMKVDGRENLREAVAAGAVVGVTAEPDAISDRRLKRIAIRDADLSISDYLVCLKERRDVPAIRALLELAPGARRVPSAVATAARGRSGRSRRS